MIYTNVTNVQSLVTNFNLNTIKWISSILSVARSLNQARGTESNLHTFGLFSLRHTK